MSETQETWQQVLRGFVTAYHYRNEHPGTFSDCIWSTCITVQSLLIADHNAASQLAAANRAFDAAIERERTLEDDLAAATERNEALVAALKVIEKDRHKHHHPADAACGLCAALAAARNEQEPSTQDAKGG